MTIRKQNNSNTQQALWLVVGQICTFAITFLTAPILARYFDKTEYGTYRQILYVYTCVQSLFTMGLPQVFAYFLPRVGMGQQKMLVRKVTMLLFLIGSIFSLLLYAFAEVIAGLLKNPELAVGLRIFSVFPMFTLPTMGVEGIYTTIRRTKEIAIYQIVSKLFMFLCIVLPVVIWDTGYREAVIGWGVASFLTFLMAMYMKNEPYRCVQSEKIPNIYREIFGYSLPLTGAFIAGSFIHFSDSFFVSRYYSTQVFAELSNGYFSIPIVAIVMGSVKSVLAPQFSGAQARGNMKPVVEPYRNALKKTSLVILPMLMFCFFFAPDIMVALFGTQYEVSGSYFRVYIVRDFMLIFPYYMVLMALGHSKFYMRMLVTWAVTAWIVDYAIVSFGGSPLCITAASSLFNILAIIVGQVFIRKKCGITLIPKNIVVHVLKILSHCLVLLLLLYSARLYVFSGMNVFVSIIMFGLVFYVLLIVTGRFVKVDYITIVENIPLFRRWKKKH